MNRPGLSTFVLVSSAAIAVVRFAARADGLPQPVLAAAVLAASTAALAHALYRVLDALRSGRRMPDTSQEKCEDGGRVLDALHPGAGDARDAAVADRFPFAFLGLLIAFSGFASWPGGLHPGIHPLQTLLLVSALLAWPACRAESRPADARARAAAERFRRILVAAALALAALATIAYAAAVRPTIASVDFFFYACYSRDLAAGDPDVPLWRYVYFPGVYAFWRAVFQLGDGSLESLQWAYLALLAANAALLGLLAGRACRSLPAGLFAAIWYPVLCSRFEGFMGTTEPLATLPLLAGLLAWEGKPLRAWTGFVRVLALGLGIGLAVYAKQQGGLLSLAAAALISSALWGPEEGRHSLGHLLLLPAASLAVFLAAIAFEGQGLEPLRWGLQFTSRYASEGSLLDNIYALAKHDESLALAAAASIAAWLALLLTPALRPALQRPAGRLATLATFAALASLAQFSWRGYRHYALLGIPFAVLAAVVLARHLLEQFPPDLRHRPLIRFLPLPLAAFPLVWSGDDPASLHPWQMTPDVRSVIPPLWHEGPEARLDLEELRRVLRPGDELLLIPPRRNEVHFVLGTRSRIFRLGYGWDGGPEDLLMAIENPLLKSVLVFTRPGDDSDQGTWELFEAGRVVSLLPQLGFRRSHELRTLDLWQR